MNPPGPTPAQVQLVVDEDEKREKKRSSSLKSKIWGGAGHPRRSSTVGAAQGAAMSRSMSPRTAEESSAIGRSLSGALTVPYDAAELAATLEDDGSTPSSPTLHLSSPQALEGGSPVPGSPVPRKKATEKSGTKNFHNFLKNRKSQQLSPLSDPNGSPGLRKSTMGKAKGAMSARRFSERSSDSSVEIDVSTFSGATSAQLLATNGSLSGSGESPHALQLSPPSSSSAPLASPKMSGRMSKKRLPGLLGKSRKAQDTGPFDRQREGNFRVEETHFEGTPVVCGSLSQLLSEGGGNAAAPLQTLAELGSQSPRSSSSSRMMVRLDGIPGGIVRKVCSAANMLGVVSQTGDLYVAASTLLHHSASGQPPPDPSQEARASRLLRVKGMGPLESIALGDHHSCAITEDGKIYTWGMNVNDSLFLTQDPPNGKGISSVLCGQLGHGAARYRFAEPIAVKGIPGKPMDAAVGASHTVVLTDEGVFTCGNPMAVGRPDSFVFDVLMVVPALDSIKISAVACGADHSLAVVDGTGAVFTWGLNDHGQLGQARQCKYAAEPMLISGSKNVAAVVAGPNHSVAVGHTGLVIVWGSNLCGELGIGSEELRIFEPTLVEAPLSDEHTVILASCSKDCTFVVTDTGEVFQAGLFPATGLSGVSRTFRRVPIEAKYVGGVAVGNNHAVYLIDQALTHLMAQLMEPRSGSAEVFVRKLLRLFQVAVASGSASLINGVQSRVNRLASEIERSLPRIRLDGAVLSGTLQRNRTVVHIVRVTNASPFRIECDCWWSLRNVAEGVDIKFTPSTFIIDEGESTFLRVETTLVDETITSGTFQTLCQLTARKVKRKVGGTSGGFASHFFMMDITFSADKARDPELVQRLVDAMGTYVPRGILRELQLNPTPPSGPTKVSFPGVVLFIDVSGFTALNARLSNLGPAGPEQVSMHLNRYFGQLIDAVHQHGGDVLKFAGDALICLFGGPGCAEDIATLALRAVQCGCDVQRGDLREYDSQQGFKLSTHVAVGSGEINWLYLGGENSNYEHIIMGDAMLQLETAVDQSKSGEVVVSDQVYALVSEKVAASGRGEKNFLIEDVTQPIPVAEDVAVFATADMEPGLRCFLPTSVLARIDALHMSWLAELRRVTVIFVNLTSLVYERGKDVQMDAINAVLRSMQEIVFRYEGMVRQFIVDDKGTVLIAAFGVPPFGHEDDPLRGIKTAWEIHHTLKDQNVSSSIGVTSGKVFCGSVGSSKRQEYAMVGDIVNLSARLMGVAKTMDTGIVVDGTTRDYTSDLVEYESLPSATVKGRDEPVVIAKPVSFKETLTDHHSHQNLPNILDEANIRRVEAMPEIPIVGRRAETGLLQLQVAKLQAMKQRAMDMRGSTKTFLLSGQAGLGKTRVINELARTCRKQNVEYYIGQCDSLEKTKPFFAFQTILEQLINLELWKQRNQKSSSSPSKDQGDHWQANIATVAAAFGIESDSNWAEYLPLLNNVLPLGLPENDMCSKLGHDKKHMLTISFLAYLFQARALQKPVVLIVEDLQWIDASSMELLAAVAEESSANTKGLLIVLSQRSQPQHPHYKQLLQLTGVEELQLVPMSAADCRQIACSTLGVPLTAWLPKLDKALDKAHGNPLFAMEIAYSLRESGAVEVVDGELVLNKLGKKMEIPETIEGMIGARIDQLPSGPQLLLKVASVIGMEFNFSVLDAIYPIASQRDTIVTSLKQLLEFGLVEPATGSTIAYRFKSETVRDVTYMRMLFTQRQQLHMMIARYYEELRRIGQSNSRTCLLLAHHWRGALLNNPDGLVEDIIRASKHLIEATSICIAEDNREEAEKFLSDCEKLANALPKQHADDRDLILLSIAEKQAYLPALLTQSKPE